MKTITLATALLLLALATRANATTIIFNDGHQWIGTLEPNPPFAFPLFSVFIGECVRSVDCLYNGQVELGLGVFSGSNRPRESLQNENLLSFQQVSSQSSRFISAAS